MQIACSRPHALPPRPPILPQLLQVPPRPLPSPLPPLGQGRGEYEWVDRPCKLAAAAMELYEQDRLALDVEHHSQHSYGGQACLLQLSTGERLAEVVHTRRAAQGLCATWPCVCKRRHALGLDPPAARRPPLTAAQAPRTF